MYANIYFVLKKKENLEYFLICVWFFDTMNIVSCAQGM